MKVKILDLKNVTFLSKKEQKLINAGFFGCQPQIIECRSDNDCPCTPCGITFTNNGVEYVLDICAY